uniref:Uncharacterized protein n=1 Tax=Anguilla anguilla TaxID=7936 RepID=A0A0E9QLM1_ANGAN
MTACCMSFWHLKGKIMNTSYGVLDQSLCGLDQ